METTFFSPYNVHDYILIINYVLELLVLLEFDQGYKNCVTAMLAFVIMVIVIPHEAFPLCMSLYSGQ